MESDCSMVGADPRFVHYTPDRQTGRRASYRITGVSSPPTDGQKTRQEADKWGGTIASCGVAPTSLPSNPGGDDDRRQARLVREAIIATEKVHGCSTVQNEVRRGPPDILRTSGFGRPREVVHAPETLSLYLESC